MKSKKGRFSLRESVSIRRSGIHGRGVFARKLIPEDTRIVEYIGERISAAEAESRYPEDLSVPYHTFLFSIDDDEMVDAAFGGNLSRWINHSCDPNCVVTMENRRLYIQARTT